MPAVITQLKQDYLLTEPTSALEKGTDNQAIAVAGCMVRSRIHEMNFTHTFGGFGLMLNRLAIENFLSPLYCPDRSQNVNLTDITFLGLNANFEQQACYRLRQNLIGEEPLFRPGMSVADLLHAYVADQPYLKYKEWNDVGFCLHSDWVFGYFINFYFIADHTNEPSFLNVPQSRLRGYRGPQIYAGRQTKAVIAARKECNHQRDACTSESHLCHYVTPDQMKSLHQKQSRHKADVMIA